MRKLRDRMPFRYLFDCPGYWKRSSGFNLLCPYQFWGVTGGRSVLSAALLLIIFAFPALAQDPAPHERFHQYYQTWKQPGMYGLSCCNANEYVDTLSGRMHISGDCEPTRAEIRNGHWWAKVPDYMIEAGVPAWVEIPEDKVIRERNPSLEEGHLCGTVEYWQGKPPTVRILCFVPPDTGG